MGGKRTDVSPRNMKLRFQSRYLRMSFKVFCRHWVWFLLDTRGTGSHPIMAWFGSIEWPRLGLGNFYRNRSIDQSAGIRSTSTRSNWIVEPTSLSMKFGVQSWLRFLRWGRVPRSTHYLFVWCRSGLTLGHAKIQTV